MCTVAQNLINIGRDEGIKEGIKEGINEGKSQSIDRLTEYFMNQNPEITAEEAKEMATKILK